MGESKGGGVFFEKLIIVESYLGVDGLGVRKKGR